MNERNSVFAILKENYWTSTKTKIIWNFETNFLSFISINLASSGDLSGHRMWTNFSGADKVLDNIAIVSSKVHSTFPKIPVFPVIGNNDLPGHYVLPNSTSDWYKKLLTFWSPLILCSGCPGYTRNLIRERVLQETFLEGGYYNTSIAGNGLYDIKILVYHF